MANQSTEPTAPRTTADRISSWIYDTRGPSISRLTLRFTDPAVERTYARVELEKSLPVMRLAMFFAVLIYAAYAVLDYYVMPEVLKEVWTIRFAIAIPIFVGVWLSTYMPFFSRVAQAGAALAMLTSGLSIIAMTAIANPPGAEMYYAGLIPLIIYCCCVPPMRFMYATAVTVILVGVYQISALALNPISVLTLLANDFFLIVASAMGVFASYTQELQRRRDFVNMIALQDEKARSEELRDKAQAANHAKSEFLAIMSHELRTPLNAIIGFSEILNKELFGPLGSKRYQEYSADILSSGTHLLEIINDILDLSKAEAGKLVLEEEVVDVANALNKGLRVIRDKATVANVRLSFDVPRGLPLLRADKRLFTQVVLNLLSNAVKFTPKGGAVSVSAYVQKDGRLSLRFSDTGIGIAPEDLPNVVAPFVQVEGAMARSNEGTGLGLPLTKNILELHGGVLDIESELGRGTTVTAIFPSERLVYQQDEESAALQEGVS